MSSGPGAVTTAGVLWATPVLVHRVSTDWVVEASRATREVPTITPASLMAAKLLDVAPGRTGSDDTAVPFFTIFSPSPITVPLLLTSSAVTSGLGSGSRLQPGVAVAAEATLPARKAEAASVATPTIGRSVRRLSVL